MRFYCLLFEGAAPVTVLGEKIIVSKYIISSH